MDAMVSGETAGTQLALRDGAFVVASSSGDNWRVIPSAPRPGEKTYEARVPNGMVGLVIGADSASVSKFSEPQVRVDGVGATSRHRDAVDVAA